MSKHFFVGSDHAGFSSKALVLQWLNANGFTADDLGTDSEVSVDYPDFAKKVATAVANNPESQGILLCGSGVGVSIVANKVKGIRAALAFSPEVASLARQHNNANVLCLPARFMSPDTLTQSLTAWINAEFEGGRHHHRVAKIE